MCVPRPSRHCTSSLVDASGSTDGWISGRHRAIDVEREALLLVSMALQTLGEPFAVLAFSGEGPHGVTLRALRISAKTIAMRLRCASPHWSLSATRAQARLSAMLRLC